MITRDDFNFVRRKAATLKVVVIGDVMLDRYIHGSVDRISPEAPVPVVRHHQTDTKAGGAANVALNLAAWGCETHLVGLVGNDPGEAEISRQLNEHQIRHKLIRDPNRPTTVKTRVVASSHHLLRIDEESTAYLQDEQETVVKDQVMDYLEALHPDLIILEDYNKGLLTPALISSIIGYAKAKHAFIAVDPKELHFFEYQGVDLFKPNLREASHAARTSLRTDRLSEIGKDWLERYHFGMLAVTLGAQGIFLLHGKNEVQVKPDRAIDVVDVCGAGDAVVCALALSLLAGLSLEKCGALANLTGAYVCSHSGVVAVHLDAIEGWI
jgi:rfaE bifunctional protein kinase chain/domain